jgi:hypothetical protein
MFLCEYSGRWFEITMDTKTMKMIKVPVPPVDNDPVSEDDVMDADGLDAQITMRPDGYYWEQPDGRQAFGPFETLEAAVADMEAADEEGQEPGETLQEAEDEIGISDWIDPETGELAEGQSHPHLEA